MSAGVMRPEIRRRGGGGGDKEPLPVDSTQVPNSVRPSSSLRGPIPGGFTRAPGAPGGGDIGEGIIDLRIGNRTI